ncbi:MAG: helix-turn-helix domain-containing protein [Clostridiales bacterium]|nr:helix-turn-helix domain-containing protein [Clostridiales bacterium]
MEITKIGERIKERRKELNLTQKDLAEGMHISDRLVSKWEVGESVPSLEYLQLLSEVLQISVQSLMGIEETAPAANEQPATAIHEQAAPPEPKPKSPSKSTTFWKKNRKPLLISIIGVASAVFLLAVILLSIFVFAPLANKKRYLEAIDKGIDRYLELGYFNIRSTLEVDGEEDESPDILQGYFDDNGKVAFYNSKTDEIVKDGVKTYKHRLGQTDFELPASVKTVPDLLEMLLKTWDDGDDAFDLEKYVKYIRKTSYGYYMEFSDKYLLDDLKPSEAKNIKITEKIKGKVVMDRKKTKTITVTAKFRNTKENENFSAVSKIEFLQSKPVIEHVNYVAMANSEHISKARFLELINASSLGSTINDKTKELFAKGSLHCENGYVFSLSDEKDVTFYDPETLQVTKTVSPSSSGIQAATVYKNYIWYVFRQSNTSTQWELRRYSLNTKANLTRSYLGQGEIQFKDKYFYYTPSGYNPSYDGFAYDLEQQKKIATSNYIRYVDSAGTVYCREGYYNPLYLYGSKESLKGTRIYKEENGYVYTADNDGVYQYKAGVYQKTVPLSTYDLQIQGEYCFTSEKDTIYDLDGNVVATLCPIRLKTDNTYYGYSNYYPRIIAIWGDIVLVHLSTSSYSESRSGYTAFYRIGEWDAPVAYVDMAVNRVVNTPSGDNILSFLYYSSSSSLPNYNDASAEFWIIKK